MLRRTSTKIEELRNYRNDNRTKDFYEGVNFACHEIELTLPKADVSWTVTTVKDHIWRPVQRAICGKESSADASKSEYIEVYENLNRMTADTFGINEQWPVKEDS